MLDRLAFQSTGDLTSVAAPLS
jgi:hypothetical protein